ncbi:MAG: glycoside hydrolase family 3 N-terminal domain-containing protein [Blautia sp.]|nr:glycoside hydrolase family 3 N-terminal domain-containing protein [Blautia sp.]
MKKYYACESEIISEREQKHMQLVRSMAGECMLLLENDGTLPLKETGRIALYGNGARHTVKGGTGSGDVNSRKTVTIEEGLIDAGFTVTTGEWLQRYDDTLAQAKRKYHKKIAEIAEKKGIDLLPVYFEHPFPEPEIPSVTEEDVKKSNTDTAIYVIARNSGEGADREYREGDYLLMESELNAITILSEKYEKTIVILNVANVIDTAKLNEISGVNAVLLAGQAGNIGGLAVADVLLAKTVPSGKLSDTWAKDYHDYASSANFSHNNGNLNDEYYTDGIYVGYRYFDTFQIQPPYCFGYGKSYTNFSIEVLDTETDGQKVSVKVRITNIGDSYSGKEVVQIYVSAPEGDLEKPYQELIGFGKSDLLAPGESQKLTISFQIASMASYSEKKAAWVLEAGTYYIRVGNSSRNTRIVAALVLEKEAVTVKLKNLFADSGIVQELSRKGIEPYSYADEKTEKEEAKVIVLDAEFIATESACYKNDLEAFEIYPSDEKLTMEDVRKGRATLENLVSQLTIDEMAAVCNGAAARGTAAGGVVGNASDAVPGAAGDTTSVLLDRGVKNIIMADGPAGLRLLPHFAVDRDGNRLPGYEVFGEIPQEKPQDLPEGAREYFQYCTAIPTASLLAQSWDMELIEQCGNIVGQEMKEYHVTLWLAPGMNIHRNPLCGRNFEYYSEDPLLSGLCAAADTKGVQSHPGIGTTIKHFAANNQEDNRMFTNAHVSERVLREIYLKGFEIAVKTAQPMSIMTSYNLLNGIHTANHYDLLTSLARNEWKFAGIIMTDWGTSEDLRGTFGMGDHLKYSFSDPGECVTAGNDLQMPGCAMNIQELVEGVKSGSIKLAQIPKCTFRILNLVSQSLAYEGAKPYCAQFGELPWIVQVNRG